MEGEMLVFRKKKKKEKVRFYWFPFFCPSIYTDNIILFITSISSLLYYLINSGDLLC